MKPAGQIGVKLQLKGQMKAVLVFNELQLCLSLPSQRVKAFFGLQRLPSFFCPTNQLKTATLPAGGRLS
eukprot:scaffold1065_cov335-Pinguiococcus_pyrenoidosus.AAC.2